MKSYKEFARIYDELMNDIDYDGWFSYIKEIFGQNNVRPKNILEMACGTGNLTKLLGEERYDITCFDLSEDMLTIAYDKLRSFKNVSILKQDMVNFRLKENFDAVLSICDSINYIIEYDDLISTFENVYSHLNNGGIFIFDINSYYKLSYTIGNNTFVNEDENVFYVWENEFNKEEGVCEFNLTFFVKENVNYMRFDESHLQRAYKSEEVISALRQAGFRDISTFDSFSFDSPNEESQRINFVVRK